MKALLYVLAIALFCPFSLSVANADSLDSKTDKVRKELLAEILVAENEDDEDLFMDDEEEVVEEEAVMEETEEVVEEPVDEEPPAPAPMAEPDPAPAPVVEKKPAPAPAPVAKKAVPTKRAPANFKGGFKVLAMDCDLHANADESSDVLLSTSAGKKLWLDKHNDGWYKGYHKKGHGYFPAGCFK